MKYKIGDKIKAKIYGNILDRYYDGIIIKINKRRKFFCGNNYYGGFYIPYRTIKTYDVRYNDGRVEKNINSENIKILNN